MKFLVGTYHIFLNENDMKDENNQYVKLNRISKAINSKYCTLNNYQYIFKEYHTKEDLDIILNKTFDESIFKYSLEDKVMTYKYKFLLDLLESHKDIDYLAYIESDACFCNPNRKLEEYIVPDKDIFISRCNWSYDVTYNMKNKMNEIINYINSHIKDILDYNKCSEIMYPLSKLFKDVSNTFFINEGFYIFKNSEISRNFLKCLYQYSLIVYLYSDLPNNHFPEGYGNEHFLKRPEFRKYVQVLPPKTNGHIYGSSNKYNPDECLLCHNGNRTLTKEQVADFMKNNIAKNKYWISYL